MSKRIQQLEIALQAEHSSHSNPSVTHPLLTTDLLAIKNEKYLFENHEGTSTPRDNGSREGTEQKREEEEEDLEEEIVNSLGLLSVSEGGETQFVGQMGFQVCAIALHLRIRI